MVERETIVEVAPQSEKARIAHLLRKMEEVYTLVPKTVCENCGACCSLTDEEFGGDYATMYPLYAIEYVYISQYILRNFDKEQQHKYFSLTEERPKRCPFRNDERGGCHIYPARPLICRTYGVLSSERIMEAVDRYREVVPGKWLVRFLRVEKNAVCPKVKVLEEEKLEQHTEYMVAGAYVQRLVKLSTDIDICEGPQREVLLETVRRSPIWWSWGGYNVLRFSSVEWFQREFPEYWQAAYLVDR